MKEVILSPGLWGTLLSKVPNVSQTPPWEVVGATSLRNLLSSFPGRCDFRRDHRSLGASKRTLGPRLYGALVWT